MRRKDVNMKEEKLKPSTSPAGGGRGACWGGCELGQRLARVVATPPSHNHSIFAALRWSERRQQQPLLQQAASRRTAVWTISLPVPVCLGGAAGGKLLRHVSASRASTDAS